MIVIELNGGLGNQMFQYALYLRLKKQGKRAMLINYNVCDSMQAMNRCTIFNVFVLDKEYSSVNTFSCFFQKFMVSCTIRLSGIIKDPEVGVFNPNVLTKKSGYFDGWWQSEKYFIDIKEAINQSFRFKKELSPNSLLVAGRIKNCKCPVSVHIRLGDYLTVGNQRLFGNICTNWYYVEAISYILQHEEDVRFFVFSNDPQKIDKSLFIGLQYEIVDVNDEYNGWEDLYLMSICKHNIIANSTFSWWGGVFELLF